MQINRDHRGWMIGTLVVVAATSALYGWYAANSPKGTLGGSWIGLGFGVAAAACMAIEWLFAARRRMRTRRIGSAQLWMRMHIWLGLLAIVLVWFHSGFALGGPLTTTLMVVFYIVSASGVVGLFLQQFVPAVMTQRVPWETVHVQIDHVLEGLAVDAYDQVASITGEVTAAAEEIAFLASEEKNLGAKAGSWRQKARQRVAEPALESSEALRDFYLAELRPFLREAGEGRRFPDFRPISLSAPEEWRAKIDRLQGLCEEARQIRIQRRLHGLLHNWLFVHVPLSFCLLVLLVVHIINALRY